ncbi:hypothetical protein ALC60_08264 [Trachymyrmex zeteki]|uniref:Uncharacterized protein n=1 Tax=Mycetomoellerius zeteki TaxID=64791 RepID=A0A151WXL9_9HYME|nr:hypothetical protein ALC60_08264 [Trachymyrmex zeteki]
MIKLRNEIYRQDDVDGFGFRYFPLSSMRVSSLVNGNLSLTPHGRSETGVNGEVQTENFRPEEVFSSYVGNNLRHAEVLARVFGSPAVISFIKFLSTRVGKFLPEKAFVTGYYAMPLLELFPPSTTHNLGVPPLPGLIPSVARFTAPDGASTNGTIARQPRSGKEQGAAKEAVGRDREARKHSLGCGRGGGKRGGEGGRQRKEGDAGCVRVVPCGIGRSQEIEHVYNVSIKCHVYELCSTRHHMLFRIFLNNQYNDDSLPFYSKKLFKEKLLVYLADNDPDACVHLTFLRSYQRRVGRGWFIEGGPYAGVSEQIQTIIFGVHFGCSSASKHFDGSSMKSAAALLFVGGVISQRRHGMSRQEKSLHGRCPKISKFVMGQFCPAGILCRQKVSQERNRLSKQEVDLPAIVALPLMPA